MKQNNSSHFGKHVRRMYLEAKLFRDGEVYTGTLMNIGVGRQQASADINWYLRQYPNVMRYCKHLKRYVRGDLRLKPQLSDRESHAQIINSLEFLATVTRCSQEEFESE
jgi:DNA polymerase I-like protein with 3'-5' exonuclease and polymerase domains